MKDYLLEKLFEQERWLSAINKGIAKEINRAELLGLCSEEGRISMYNAIRSHRYRIAPPHTAQIPKPTPGEFRTVYINENRDRILLSLINDMLFELCPEMVHKSCTSYQTGIGCGQVVVKASKMIADANGEIIGWKSDLSKYFDSVPLRYIDGVFDKVEDKFGKSAVIEVVREYYHSNIYLDDELNVCDKYQSLKQGSAVASFLADAILYHIDEKLSALNGYYVRYSDDTLFIGPDYAIAMEVMSDELQQMEMKLNPKKIEYLDSEHWFGFLGYSIKGANRSLRAAEIKKFQREIEERTIRNHGTTLRQAVHAVNRYLYRGDGKHSWATRVLRVINVKEDIYQLNNFVIDCLRAVATGKSKLGGLGFVKNQKVGCINRGRGRNVTTNRHKVNRIDGYLSIQLMQNALQTSRDAYECLVAQC